MSAANHRTAKEYAALIAVAKARIDHGFSRAGHSFKAADARARAAALLSGRVVAMSNAMVLLAQHHHANESLPILRSLMEAAARLACLAQKDGADQAQNFWAQSRELSWVDLFGTQAPAGGGQNQAFAAAFEAAATRACRSHFLANWGGLPWSHVFGQAPEEAVLPEEALRLTATAMASALESLNAIWPDRFEGAQEIFSGVRP